jgi:hypothetical protein
MKPYILKTDLKTISVSYIANLSKSLNIRHKLSTTSILKEEVSIAKFIKQLKNSFIYLSSEHIKCFSHEIYLKVVSQSLCVVSTYGMGFNTQDSEGPLMHVQF